MPRISRRKTLSHTEVESFLCSSSNATSTDTLEEKLVRDYCRATFGRKQGQFDDNEKLREIGRLVLDITKYPIMQTRIIKPELFLHPIASLEAKKSILIGLSPMLSDAEEQRKSESLACELFTRCKSSKEIGRSSYYCYTDMDTHNKIGFAEYETRFVAFKQQL